MSSKHVDVFIEFQPV